MYRSHLSVLCLMPQSHHNPVPRTGCSQAVLNKNRMSTHGAAPYEFCLPVRGPLCMHYKLTGPYGFRDGKQPVRAPHGSGAAKYDARAGFLPILVVSVPLRVHKGALRHPCRSRTGPVGYEKH